MLTVEKFFYSLDIGDQSVFQRQDVTLIDSKTVTPLFFAGEGDIKEILGLIIDECRIKGSCSLTLKNGQYFIQDDKYRELFNDLLRISLRDIIDNEASKNG
jgi:hypothetical protein